MYMDSEQTVWQDCLLYMSFIIPHTIYLGTTGITTGIYIIDTASSSSSDFITALPTPHFDRVENAFLIQSNIPARSVTPMQMATSLTPALINCHAIKAALKL